MTVEAVTAPVGRHVGSDIEIARAAALRPIEEIAEPLGADFHIGLTEHHHGRVGEMGAIPLPMPGEGPQLGMVIMSDPEGISARAFMNPPSMAFGVNNAPWRTAEIPGANGHANARAMARIYGVLARGGEQDGVHLLDAKGIARCHEERV